MLRRCVSYVALPDDDNDSLPEEMRHVRYSEKASDLLCIGLVNEALSAIEIVSNRCFGRSFHRAKTSSEGHLEPMNQNTLPGERTVRDMAERIEAQGFHAITEEIQTRSKAGGVITHTSDSTTKKTVGKFIVLGIHINPNTIIPLPRVPVAGETREEVAQQAGLGFEILSDSREPSIKAAELYKEVDAHMTDSVSHNKPCRRALRIPSLMSFGG